MLLCCLGKVISPQIGEKIICISPKNKFNKICIRNLTTENTLSLFYMFTE